MKSKSKTEVTDKPSAIKVGIIGGLENDKLEILKNAKTKTIKTTLYGKPSDDLLLGKIEGVDCVFLCRNGKKSSIMPGNINYRANIMALKDEGCTHILATAIAGTLTPNIKKGDFVVMSNFVDRTHRRHQTFYDGEKDHPQGVCHMAMEPPFCEDTRRVIIQTAKQLEIPVITSGTVLVIEGPRFSTLAETELFKQWGIDLVSMSLVPEVILAKEAGICYAAVALATDYDVSSDERDDFLCTTKVLAAMKKHSTRMNRLITGTIRNLAREDWDRILRNLQKLVKNSIISISD